MTAEPVQATEYGADLRHVRSWIFDLDDTLYPPESQFMGLIQQRINDYVVRTAGLPAEQAMTVQKGYLRDYGTSLAGLMAHYKIDPHDFLAEVHDVPLDVLTPDPGLRAALERLEGPRIVFTNGSMAHARRVVEKLKIREEGIAMRYLEINGTWEDHVRYAITAEDWWERRDDLLNEWVG